MQALPTMYVTFPYQLAALAVGLWLSSNGSTRSGQKHSSREHPSESVSGSAVESRWLLVRDGQMRDRVCKQMQAGWMCTTRCQVEVDFSQCEAR